MMNSRSWLVAAALFVACSSPTSNQTPPPTSTTATIGPAGGTVKLEGLTLTIPANALATPTKIDVTKTTPTLPGHVTASGSAYSFEPKGLHFRVPATVSFDAPGTKPGATAIYWSTISGRGFARLRTRAQNDKLTALITHFSTTAVGTAAPQELDFPGSPTTLPSSGSVAGTAVGDVNGDSIPDLVTTSNDAAGTSGTITESPVSVSSSGAVSTGTPEIVQVAVPTIGGITTVDVNLDGVDDVVAAAVRGGFASPEGISLAIAQGMVQKPATLNDLYTPGANDKIDGAVTASATRGFTSDGAFNGDDFITLIELHDSPSFIVRSTPQASGNVASAEPVKAPIQADSLHVGDVDGDGHPDAVLTNKTGDVAVQTKSGFITGKLPGTPTDVDVADTDGDGRDEVITLNQEALDVMGIGGNNEFSARAHFSADAPKGDAVRLKIVSHDGTATAVAIVKNGSVVSLHVLELGAKNPEFKDTGVRVPASAKFDVTVADIDDDGVLDAVLQGLNGTAVATGHLAAPAGTTTGSPDAGSAGGGSPDAGSTSHFPGPEIDDLADPNKNYAHMTWVDHGQKIALLGHHFFIWGDFQLDVDGQPITGAGEGTPKVNGVQYDSIEFYVPSNYTNGVITVTTQSGSATFTLPTLIDVPKITSIDPPGAKFGDTVSLVGEHFIAVNGVWVGSDPNDDGDPISYTFVDSTRINVTLDRGWASCPLYFRVQNAKGMSAASAPFVVLVGGTKSCVETFDCQISCFQATPDLAQSASCRDACVAQEYSQCGKLSALGAFGYIFDQSQHCSMACGNPGASLSGCHDCLAQYDSTAWAECVATK